jgi:hypothetical protein
VSSRLKSLQNRIAELNKLSVEVIALGKCLSEGDWIGGSNIAVKAEDWYRGSRALLERENFSGMEEFDLCYRAYYPDVFNKTQMVLDPTCIYAFVYSPVLNQMVTQSHYPFFAQKIAKGTALLNACVSEVKSRELPILGDLSFVVASDEFETASNLLQSSREETIVRASGVVARVALERHIRTVAEERNVTILKKSPHKVHPDFSDITLSLSRASVITEVQRARLETLYKIGNNCAHPKESVKTDDVEELIRDGRSLTALIV